MFLNDLSRYLEVDELKRRMLESAAPKLTIEMVPLYRENVLLCDVAPCEKYCPKCGREYPKGKNFCPDCLIVLKDINDRVHVRDLKTNPEFPLEGVRKFDDFAEIFTEENTERIDEFDFSIDEFRRIANTIKKTAFTYLDGLLKENDLYLESLSPLDSVLIFTKSFVNVSYKGYGQELGYFEADEITVDDRQVSSLQITTLIHELAHFLLKEIITQVLCRILDCSRSDRIEAVVMFILSYSHFTQLIDEYCAHSCEARFTVYGYQDYSSFLKIISEMGGEMTRDEIEITKSIGNTFSFHILAILESFIDADLREEIKEQFLRQNRDRPNYEMLKLENCNRLTDEGFIKAMKLILNDGFRFSAMNVEKLESLIH